MEHRTLVASFRSEREILAAAREARAAGFGVSDAFTPFPVHGMDEALGLPPSWLGRACFALGLAGLTLALGFQYWVSVFDWPMNIGGKPYHASPALIPVAFELTVLVAGVGTVLVFLIYRGLRPGRAPRFAGLGATDDRFLLALRVKDGGSGRQRVEAFLRERGASAVEELRGEP